MNTLVYTELPDNVFIPVIRKRDIVRARPLSREEKREYGKGCPDILLVSPTGEQRLITRQELLSNFTYLNGRKININGWSSKKNYMVVRMDDTQLFAMLVPYNCTINIKGRNANKNQNRRGDFIICLTDNNGGIDRGSANLISNKIFKKMFHIPENEVITRNIGKGNQEFNPAETKNRRRNSNRVNNSPHKNKNVVTPDFGLNEDAFAQMASEIQRQPSKPADTSIIKNNPANTDRVAPTNQQYTAIGRLMQNGVIAGFVIQNSKGATRNVTKQEMMQLCQRKMISNVILSRKESGAYYLRGNGIRIDMLQSYDI